MSAGVFHMQWSRVSIVCSSERLSHVSQSRLADAPGTRAWQPDYSSEKEESDAHRPSERNHNDKPIAPTGYAPVNSLNLYYESHGSGVSLILLRRRSSSSLRPSLTCQKRTCSETRPGGPVTTRKATR